MIPSTEMTTILLVESLSSMNVSSRRGPLVRAGAATRIKLNAQCCTFPNRLKTSNSPRTSDTIFQPRPFLGGGPYRGAAGFGSLGIPVASEGGKWLLSIRRKTLTEDQRQGKPDSLIGLIRPRGRD